VSLRSCLDRLEDVAPRELVTVNRRVSAEHELSEIVKALEPYGAPVVRFEQVMGSRLPVVVGVFGQRERIARFFGVPARDLVSAVRARLKTTGHVRHVNAHGDAPWRERVLVGNQVDLALLPVGIHSRGDSGAFITSAVGVSRGGQWDNVNLGIYRLRVIDSRHVTINVVPDNNLGRILRTAKRQAKPVEIAFVLGADPAFVCCSQINSTLERDGFELASAVTNRTCEVTDCVSIGHSVPVDSEIVLEGVIDTASGSIDGPFGEFSYYHGSSLAMTCEIVAMSLRSDAIYQDLHPTHREHRYLWSYPGREAWLSERLSPVSAGVREVVIPQFGAFFAAFVSMTPSHEGDARRILLSALGVDNMLKYVVAVNEDIDIWDATQVAWAVAVRCQPDRDVITIANLPGVHNDPSAYTRGTGDRPDFVTAKMGLDATIDLSGEFPERADLAADGFEQLQLSKYLSPDTLDALRAWIPPGPCGST